MRANNEYLFLREEQAGRLEINRTGEVYRIKQGGKKSRIDHVCNDGYRNVSIEIDGKQINCRAHRIIWLKYNAAIPDDAIIHHKNSIRWDNHIDNLEQVNQSENIRNSITTNLERLAIRVNLAKSKVSPEQLQAVYDNMTLCKLGNAV
jgi:acetyltransferase-like isoleucine patch superfamily enzyme